MKLNSKKQQDLRRQLKQRAIQLKQKLIEDTHNLDYSVKKLARQAFMQIQKQKKGLYQMQQLLKYSQNSQTSKIKTQAFKRQMLKHITNCQQTFQNNLTRIKKKRNRIYTWSNGPQNNKSITQMLLTAKDQFKIQHLQKKLKLNSSQIKNFNKFNNSTYASQLKCKFNTQSFVIWDQVQEEKQFHNKKQKTDLNNFENTQVRNIYKFKNNAKLLKNTTSQLLNQSSMSIKQVKGEYQNRKKRKHPYAFSKCYQKKVDTQQIKKYEQNSQRSIFVPLGNIKSSSKVFINKIATQLQNKSLKLQQRSISLYEQTNTDNFNDIVIKQLKQEVPISENGFYEEVQEKELCLEQNNNFQLNWQNDYNKQREDNIKSYGQNPLSLSLVTQQQLEKIQKNNDLNRSFFKQKNGFIELQNNTKVRIKIQEEQQLRDNYFDFSMSENLKNKERNLESLKNSKISQMNQRQRQKQIQRKINRRENCVNSNKIKSQNNNSHTIDKQININKNIVNYKQSNKNKISILNNNKNKILTQQHQNSKSQFYKNNIRLYTNRQLSKKLRENENRSQHKKKRGHFVNDQHERSTYIGVNGDKLKGSANFFNKSVNNKYLREKYPIIGNKINIKSVITMKAQNNSKIQEY